MLPKFVDPIAVRTTVPESPATMATMATIVPQVQACVKLTGDNCPRSYCEEVSKQQWKNNNHNTCTAVKRNAGTANPGCYASGPCYEG